MEDGKKNERSGRERTTKLETLFNNKATRVKRIFILAGLHQQEGMSWRVREPRLGQ